MQHAAELVERPGESQEALDGKKSHLEVDLSLNSFVDFLVVLAVLSPRPTGTSVLLCKGSRI